MLDTTIIKLAILSPAIMLVISIFSFYIFRKNEKKKFVALFKHLGKTILYSLAGIFVGYYVGLALFCFLPGAGAQCGLGAVFFTVPIGLCAGAILYIYIWVNKNSNKSLNQTGAKNAPPS